MAIAQQNTRQGILGLAPATFAAIKGQEDDDCLDGLDDLVRGHTAQKVEERKEVNIIADEKFKELWGKYVTALNLVDTLKVDLIGNYLNASVTEVLTPQEIEEFFRLTVAYEECTYYQKCTTNIVNKLIKNSYNAGHREFVLDTSHLSKPLDDLCANLGAYGDKPIKITVNGNVGRDFGSSAEYYMYFIINGDVVSCGRNSICSSYVINGNVDYIPGSRKQTSFVINGEIRNYFNCSSDYISLTLTGEIEQFEVGDYSGLCTFKTSNPKTLDVFLRHTPLMKGHKVYFINEDGTETKIGAWDRFVKRVGYKLHGKKEQ